MTAVGTARRLSLIALVVATACAAAPASAPAVANETSCGGPGVADSTGPTWSLRRPEHVPPARAGAAIAFDETRGQVVLFGGRSAGRVFGDTWIWDGSTWTEQHPSSAPPPRESAGFASDHAGHVVLFGGSGSLGGKENSLGDTWAWNGNDWTKEHPTQSPLAGTVNVMASIGSSGALLFGTFDSFSHQGDWQTWRWDGQQWTVLLTMADALPTTGVALGSASMDDDGSILYFGGREAKGALNETWRFVGRDWSQVRPSAAPPARYAAGLAFLSRGKALLFGGHGSAVPTLGDTWTWSDSSWTQVTPQKSPSPRNGQAMVFDVARHEVLLFGGAAIASDFTETPLCDTWVWRP